VDAEAGTAVLALRRAPLRARLGQKHRAELRFDAEVDIGPADALKLINGEKGVTRKSAGV